MLMEVKNNIPDGIPVDIDRVNNISQKELAMHKAGVTRRNINDVIAQGMVAVKTRTEIIDGEVHKIEEPDMPVRLKSAELGLDAMNDRDKVRHVEPSHKVSITISPTDVGMLQRLADVLEGMNKRLFELPVEMRGDVIDITPTGGQ